ncbi:fatty acid synthase-like isoform X4 [Temnothorax americanus]|uniref:fatty acid synthase-like isoform X4 n=1 Tax=Temnothorax americanus TaxID=1964332 RepID=UPI0040690DFB
MSDYIKLALSADSKEREGQLIITRALQVIVYNMPHRIGKINNVEKFDPEFFNIPATEAHMMDPMARMILEHTYEAIIDAGVNPKELQGTRTGVFTGICADTQSYSIYFKPYISGMSYWCNRSFVANRISYWLGTTGPSFNLDNACSSSHFVMTEAYNMIRSGNCDAAIVATANLCLHPYINFGFYRLGVLSSDGYCRPFDEAGSGYMRSDAMTVVYLQKAKNAKRIYATFVYGKTNCDGFKEEGITFPSFKVQKMLLKEFYEECGISPSELSYMEAHATGTIVGDPAEITSIDQTLCAKRNTLMGSIKSNLGHSEPASGLCQIAKILLAMETGIIMPTIHFKCPRKELTAIIEGRIKIVTEPTEWEGGYVGINSFGFGGANCHILLKSNPKQKINNGASNNDLSRLVIVSGRTEKAVKIILDDYVDFVIGNPEHVDIKFEVLLHLDTENYKARYLDLVISNLGHLDINFKILIHVDTENYGAHYVDLVIGNL